MSTSFINELKRRNVVKVAIAYAIVAWLLIQVASVILPTFEAPRWVLQTITFVIIIGFPLSLIFAWAFELTPEGIKRSREVETEESITHITGQKLNYTITTLLSLAVVFLIIDNYVLERGTLGGGDRAPAVTDKEPAKSIAVLPFVDMSPDKDQEHFSDGISEELLNVLAKLPGLHVAARTSSFQFKGQNQDISNIGRQLGVAHVLEGSIRKAGARLRITAQLIDVANGFHLWSETYDRELNDVFAIQDEISAAISDALKVHLGVEAGGQMVQSAGASTAPAAKVARTVSPEVYDRFLLGRHLINQRNKQSLETALGHFEAVVAADPAYAPAWAAMGETILLLDNNPCCYGDIPTQEVIVRAGQALDKAMALDPNLAEAWAPMIMLYDRKGDAAGGLAASDRAITLNPNLARAYMWRAMSLDDSGRLQEAFDSRRKAVELDPLSIVANSNLASSLAARGQIDEAQRHIDKVEQLSPVWGFSLKAGLANQQGDHVMRMVYSLQAVAAQSDRSSITLFTGFYLIQLGIAAVAEPLLGQQAAWARAAGGDSAGALQMAQQAFVQQPDAPRVVDMLAAMLLLNGERQGARRQLERLFEVEPSHIWHNDGIAALVMLADLRREAGDTAGADMLLRQAREVIETRAAAGLDDRDYYIDHAIVLATEVRESEAYTALEKAVKKGWLLTPNALPIHGFPDAFIEQARFRQLLAEMEANRSRARADIAARVCGSAGADVPDSELKQAICQAITL